MAQTLILPDRHEFRSKKAAPRHWGIENLMPVLRLEIGIPAEMLDLLELPITLERGDYLTLRRTGVMIREMLW